MTQHTPGPWETSVLSNGKEWQVCQHGGGDMIADLSQADNQKANAALIAAAPELLHALSRILAAHDSGNNGAVMGEASLCPMFATMARHVITKAKG
jgi:hypothetical protein